jgi:hypothetical protein
MQNYKNKFCATARELCTINIGTNNESFNYANKYDSTINNDGSLSIRDTLAKQLAKANK